MWSCQVKDWLTGVAISMVISGGLLLIIEVEHSYASPHQDLRQLVVAAEDRCTHYRSKEYPYPQSVEAQLIKQYGGVYSPYTGRWFRSSRETDIEHIVAKSEAHDSGMCRASSQLKAQFARDLLNLTLASVSVNRHQKRGYDAAEWLPKQNRCWFVARVIQVKKKYALSVDPKEYEVLHQVVSGCVSFALKLFTQLDRQQIGS